MKRNTSILLGDYLENFIDEQISSGKFNSSSEVIISALRLLEERENKKNAIINELIVGEKSCLIRNFDRNKNLEKLNANFQD